MQGSGTAATLENSKAASELTKVSEVMAEAVAATPNFTQEALVRAPLEVPGEPHRRLPLLMSARDLAHAIGPLDGHPAWRVSHGPLLAGSGRRRNRVRRLGPPC